MPNDGNLYYDPKTGTWRMFLDGKMEPLAELMPELNAALSQAVAGLGEQITFDDSTGQWRAVPANLVPKLNAILNPYDLSETFPWWQPGMEDVVFPETPGETPQAPPVRTFNASAFNALLRQYGTPAEEKLPTQSYETAEEARTAAEAAGMNWERDPRTGRYVLVPSEPEAAIPEETYASVAEAMAAAKKAGTAWARDARTGLYHLIPAKEKATPRDPVEAVMTRVAAAIDAGDFDSGLELYRRAKEMMSVPTEAEKLQMALDVARSPADYLTVLGMMRGEIPITPLAGGLPRAFQRLQGKGEGQPAAPAAGTPQASVPFPTYPTPLEDQLPPPEPLGTQQFAPYETPLEDQLPVPTGQVPIGSGQAQAQPFGPRSGESVPWQPGQPVTPGQWYSLQNAQAPVTMPEDLPPFQSRPAGRFRPAPFTVPLEDQFPSQPFGPAAPTMISGAPVPAGAVALPGGGYAFGRGSVPTEAERWQDEQRARLAAQAQPQRPQRQRFEPEVEEALAEARRSSQQPQGFTPGGSSALSSTFRPGGANNLAPGFTPGGWGREWQRGRPFEHFGPGRGNQAVSQSTGGAPAAGADVQLRKPSPDGGYDYASIRGDQAGMLEDFRRRGYETFQAPPQTQTTAPTTQPFAPGTPSYLRQALGADVLSGGEVKRRTQIPDILAGVSPENPFGRFMSAQGWNRMTIPEQEMFRGELANRGISGPWAAEYERQRRGAAEVGGGRRRRIQFAASY